MIRTLAQIAILLWIAIVPFFIIYSLPSPTPIYEAPVTQRQAEKRTEDNGADQGIASPRGVLMWVHSNRDDINAFSTITIAAFTVILAVFTVSLASSTRRSADLAKNEFVSSQRPNCACAMSSSLAKEFLVPRTAARFLLLDRASPGSSSFPTLAARAPRLPAPSQ